MAVPRQEACDLAVIGGGSGGVAAALAAARLGLTVVIVESGDMLGGTATRGGVNCWESGVGGTGIPFDIYRRMKRDRPDAVAIQSYGRHFSWQDDWYWPHRLDKVNFPGGELLIDPGRHYRDTLRRHRGPNLRIDKAWQCENWHGAPFLPDAMAQTQAEMLHETGRVDIMLGRRVVESSARGGRVDRVRLDDGTPVAATAWIDGTGGAFCHDLGCETLQGIDPRSRFDEPSAPEEAALRINGVTLIYRVEPADGPQTEALPGDIPATCWWAKQFPPMQCVQYPDLSRNCNMLPTMEGKDYLDLGYDAAYAECTRRLRAHWHFIQTHWPEFRHFRLGWIAPMLGIREDRRVVCEKTLTEIDVRLGLSHQSDADIVAIADHALDRHGEGGSCPELDEPYGIPYRCLVPAGWRNLLVACRGAGLSSIAASSCRLSRTMMQLGQAAGTAAALVHERGVDLPDVPPDALRASLAAQHVQLQWPAPPSLQEHLSHETDVRTPGPVTPRTSASRTR